MIFINYPKPLIFAADKNQLAYHLLQSPDSTNTFLEEVLSTYTDLLFQEVALLNICSLL